MTEESDITSMTSGYSDISDESKSMDYCSSDADTLLRAKVIEDLE